MNQNQPLQNIKLKCKKQQPKICINKFIGKDAFLEAFDNPHYNSAIHWLMIKALIIYNQRQTNHQYPQITNCLSGYNYQLTQLHQQFKNLIKKYWTRKRNQNPLFPNVCCCGKVFQTHQLIKIHHKVCSLVNQFLSALENIQYKYDNQFKNQNSMQIQKKQKHGDNCWCCQCFFN